MFGESTSLSDLKQRRQLLVVESELNRAQLGAEWLELKAGMHHWARQVRAVGSMAASAASIGTNVGGFFRGLFHHQQPPIPAPPSLFKTVLSGARAGLSIWNSVKGRFK
jgi:hypothetical protein